MFTFWILTNVTSAKWCLTFPEEVTLKVTVLKYSLSFLIACMVKREIFQCHVNELWEQVAGITSQQRELIGTQGRLYHCFQLNLEFLCGKDETLQ